MYHLAPTGSDPAPLDFNAPLHANAVADAFDSDSRPHGQSHPSALDTGALLSAIGLSVQAIREIQSRSCAPDFSE